ncbi:MAG TPA: Fe-S cluster assembly protein SufD [Nostocaceae cyanobacterium]|nr:Fe-S cluster assembly protein SufD [Nostocaceae cyanobacterium]
MTIQVSPSPIPNGNSLSVTASLLDRDNYLTELLNRVTATKSTGWLQELKDNAANWVRHSVIPNTREEEWRFTDLSDLRKIKFENVETFHGTSLQNEMILPEAENSRLVFVNGIFAPELSAISDLPVGLFVGNFASLPESYAERTKNYLAQTEGTQEVFTALNTAGLNDFAVVWVSKNVVVEKPIHLLFVASVNDTAIISQPRCLVVAEVNSQVTLVEEYLSTSTDGVYFTNGVTEIWLEENSQVSHNRITRESANAFHIGKTAVTQARDSRYIGNAVTIGTKLSRHNLEILQTGEQTQTTLNGLSVIWGNQLADTHSAIALNHPHGTSQQIHKNIIGDRAHAVFNGKVFVPKPAQLTDAAQLNRNLLLSSKARVDTKPQLEITADNVKCAHGATVSQLEDDEIFYLQSRGIDENDARKLLVYAFAAEIINQIPIPSLQQKLLATVNSLQSSSND